MKISAKGPNGSASSTKLQGLRTVSERKLKANRENAKKSTGPKTAKGKGFSRKNALKYGLFVRHATDFEALSEDPQEYEKLLNGLREQYQPVGMAEEIEVERIAICYWKLKRAWRYENAVNLAARRDFVRAELDYQEEYCKEKDKQEEALLVELQSAKKEIEDKGEVSPELKQRMFGMMPGFEALWSELEKRFQQLIQEPAIAKMARRLKSLGHSRDTYVVTIATFLHEPLRQRREINVWETAIGRYAIPDDEALDKILRYEAAVNRDLGRALDRLERLQRRRNGEMIPPPVSVRLTR
jgi:hypothetical protein